jgi:hypothetical protein
VHDRVLARAGADDQDPGTVSIRGWR